MRHQFELRKAKMFRLGSDWFIKWRGRSSAPPRAAQIELLVTGIGRPLSSYLTKESADSNLQVIH